MHERGKSDSPVVPAKPPNKAGRPVAEVVEERGLAEGNTDDLSRPGRSAGQDVSSGLDRVREVARKDKDARFTALLHHVDLNRLQAAYWAINPKAASGVDQVTWSSYGQDLEENLEGLHRRVHSGAYRASPSRRAYISKADGRLRPLGIATLEDKICQRAVVEVLNAIYEEDFCGFSYGFRPGRSQHDALDALTVGIERKRVNWVLDADVKDFFTSLDHDWLARFVEHRIADKRVLRLIRKWVNAGVIEDGKWTASEVGAPQGASASPLLANIYLHYVLDRWVRQWRRQHAHGEVIIVRFADDCAPRTQRGSRCRRSSQPMWCCARDRGGPSGIALQGEVSNHRKVRRLRAGVLSVAEKAGGQPVRCEPRRRAKANHSMTRRKRRDDIETGESRCSGRSLVGACLLTRWCPASRWREFGSGSGTERGNLVPDTGPAVQLGEEPPGWRERDLQVAETTRS